MSSIDAAADKFFAEMLLSLRQAMQRRGASFYPAGPDAAASSSGSAASTMTVGVMGPGAGAPIGRLAKGSASDHASGFCGLANR